MSDVYNGFFKEICLLYVIMQNIYLSIYLENVYKMKVQI